jgi:AraC-like DNA-binding protein
LKVLFKSHYFAFNINILSEVLVVQRQVLLSTWKDMPYFIFPESVGWYYDFPQHQVDRKEGEWTTYSIHLVVRGKGYIEHQHHTYTLGRGDAFLYFPGQQQRYYSDSDDPWEVRWVHFYGQHIKELLYEQHFAQLLWKHSRIEPFEACFHELLLEVESYDLLRRPTISTFTDQRLSEFLQYAQPYTMSRSLHHAQQKILDILPQLQKSACEPFSLADWASQVGMSTYYFCKMFHKAIGMTPMQFVTATRIQMAKQWLLDAPDKSIAEVAELVGYHNASYFIYRFRTQEGVTPNEYRLRQVMQ